MQTRQPAIFSATTHKVVYAALAGNLAIAVTKFVATWFTGSSAMLSEGVHSLVDTINELLLLYGLHRAEKNDRSHPLGYGHDLYFWIFIVALLVFALCAGVSARRRLAFAETGGNGKPFINYIVLGLSFCSKPLRGTSR